MPNPIICVLQIKPVRDIQETVKNVEKLMRDKCDSGKPRPDLFVLPEMFYHPYELKHMAALQEPRGGPTLRRMQDLARELRVYICPGSIVECDGDKLFNTAYLLSRTGEILLRYEKTHLFDVSIGGMVAMESSVFTRGRDPPSVANTPEFGRVGLLVCYDIRFPELARRLALQGANLILVPAAFSTKTGRHWKPVFRTRAIENQCYVVAASPARDMAALYHAWGHSAVFGPFGNRVCKALEDEEVICAEFSFEELDHVREMLPLLRHRRPSMCVVGMS